MEREGTPEERRTTARELRNQPFVLTRSIGLYHYSRCCRQNTKAIETDPRPASKTWPQYQLDSVTHLTPFPCLYCLSPIREVPRSVRPIQVLMLEHLLEWPADRRDQTVQKFDNSMVHPAEGFLQHDLIYAVDFHQQAPPISPELFSRSPQRHTPRTPDTVTQWNYAPHTVSRLLWSYVPLR